MSPDDHIEAHRLLLAVFPREVKLQQAYGWMSGEGWGHDTFWFTDGVIEVQTATEPPGFHRGRLWTPNTAGRVWIHRGDVGRSVRPDEVETFLAGGYQVGMAPVDRSHTKGTVLINNGLIELRVKGFVEEEYPGFRPGRLEENKRAATRQGFRWFTDGTKNVQATTAPNGYVPGKCEHRPRKAYPTGRKWFTDGVRSVQIAPGEEAPLGFRPGRR